MHKLPAIDQVTRLQMEIDSLQLANASLEQQLLADAETTVKMMQELERQKNELAQANLRYKSQIEFTQRVIDTTSALIIMLDYDGRIRQVNRQSHEVLFGLEKTPQNMVLDDWLHPDERQELTASLPKLPWSVFSPLYETVRLNRVYSGEHQLRSLDGNYYQYLLEASLQFNEQGKIEGAVISATDITQIMIQQELLQRSEKRLKEAQQIAQLGHWALNLTSNVMSWSEEINKMLGFKLYSNLHSAEEYLSLVHKDDVADVKEFFTCISTTPACEIDHKLQFSDGRIKWVHIKSVTYFDEAGQPQRKVGTLQDITAKHNDQDQLRLAAGVFDNSLNGIMITDPTGNIIRVNRVFCDITGYSAEDVLGHKPSILHSGQHDDSFYKRMWADIKAKGKWQGEIWNKRKNGEMYQELLSISAIQDTNQHVTQYVGIFTDITEQRRLEEQLRQSQKMEAIGTLVGGIAHDFNNTLAAIQGNLHLAKVYNKTNDAVAAKLEVIEQLGKHSSQIIQQLLMFARKSSLQISPVSLNDLFTKLEKLVNSFVPENIVFDFHLCEQSLIVKGDESQLQQVMLNLFNNACDAVSGSSRPRIICTLEAVEADEEFLRAHPELAHGRLAHILLSDNGHGIAQEHIGHIFEPFFTTKKGGKGTGLGLSMVYGAIQTHHGTITVNSKVNRGTSIHIYLPTIEYVQSEHAADETDTSHSERQFTILLVDDNLHVRNTYAEALENLGYKVISADNGLDALECYAKHKERIDLVMSDIVMPKMGGFDAVTKMRVARPELPAIFMTGYDPDIQIPQELRIHSRVLNKPFTIVHMIEMIQQMLGRDAVGDSAR